MLYDWFGIIYRRFACIMFNYDYICYTLESWERLYPPSIWCSFKQLANGRYLPALKADPSGPFLVRNVPDLPVLFTRLHHSPRSSLVLFFFNKPERVTAVVIPVAYQFNDVLLSPSPPCGSAKKKKIFISTIALFYMLARTQIKTLSQFQGAWHG